MIRFLLLLFVLGYFFGPTLLQWMAEDRAVTWLLLSHLASATFGGWVTLGIGRVLLSREIRDAGIEQAEQGHGKRIAASLWLWRLLFG